MYTRTGLLFFLVSVLQCAAAASAVSEVDHLIAYVDQSGCAFIRNGSPADSHAAAAHLRQKQRFANGRVKTAEQFIDVVKQGRGERLKESPELFSGLMWTGQRSIELGLADALGSVDYVAREVIKADTIVDFTPHENIAERFARRFGATLAETLVGSSTSAPHLR